MQPILPFPHLKVPSRVASWLALANAGEYPNKKFWFYPFKTRFLKAHGISDGLDLQVITVKCWCGDGIFRGRDDMGQLPEHLWETCHKCSGTGIYMAYVAGRDVYKQKFEGLIQHEPVDGKAATRAMERLLLRYEPETLKRLYLDRISLWTQRKKFAVSYNFRRLNERIRALYGVKELDEVPF